MYAIVGRAALQLFLYLRKSIAAPPAGEGFGAKPHSNVHAAVVARSHGVRARKHTEPGPPLLEGASVALRATVDTLVNSLVESKDPR